MLKLIVLSMRAKMIDGWTDCGALLHKLSVHTQKFAELMPLTFVQFSTHSPLAKLLSSKQARKCTGCPCVTVK